MTTDTGRPSTTMKAAQTPPSRSANSGRGSLAQSNRKASCRGVCEEVRGERGERLWASGHLNAVHWMDGATEQPRKQPSQRLPCVANCQSQLAYALTSSCLYSCMGCCSRGTGHGSSSTGSGS